MDRPIFEIRIPAKNKHYKIYEDGTIEGFEEGAQIINRIYCRLDQVRASSFLSSSCPSNRPTSDKDGDAQGKA